MKIISVTNRKGGVGKTTTAVNIATAMAAIGKKVALFDLDPQGNATTSLGINKKEISCSAYDVLINGANIRSALQTTLVPQFYIVPSTPDLAAAEVELINVTRREYILQNVLRALSGDFDYVLIDCPPSLNLLTVNALTASNSVIVPLQCEFLALEGLTDLVKNIERVKRMLNPNLKLQGIVLTMFDRRNNLSFMVEKDVRKYFGDLVYQTVIPRSVRISEAPSHGKPIMLYDFKSIGAQSYIKLAKEVLTREGDIK
ncbi:MAG: ParA family protein [Alphaproteobacteria bacterium]|nr:ParA family protein [Alphaproteobacteria bacterium]